MDFETIGPKGQATRGIEGRYLFNLYADRKARLVFTAGRPTSQPISQFVFSQEELRNLAKQSADLVAQLDELEARDELDCPNECGSTVVRDASTPTGFRVVCGDGCATCGPGVDEDSETSRLCPTCNGEGEYLSKAGKAARRLSPDTTCPTCGGTGRLPSIDDDALDDQLSNGEAANARRNVAAATTDAGGMPRRRLDD